MTGIKWGIGWEELKWAITCLIMVAPLIQNAVTSRASGRASRAFAAPEWTRPRRFSTADRPLIERTIHVLSDLEVQIQGVVRGRELLTITSVLRIQEAELSARIASKERALVECGLLNEPAGVSYYLDNLLLLPFSPVRHRTPEELGLLAMKQAYAARDLWEAIQKLRRTLGPAD